MENEYFYYIINYYRKIHLDKLLIYICFVYKMKNKEKIQTIK